MFETPIISSQGEDQNCFGMPGTNWFSMGRQDNIRSRQRKVVGGERMRVSDATRSLPRQTPQSECTLVIPFSIIDIVDTNPVTGRRSSQPAVSQASTAMQGLPSSVYKRQPQQAQTMPVNMAQSQQTRTVSDPQGRQRHVSRAPRMTSMTSAQQFQAGNSGKLRRRNALLGARNVGVGGGVPSFGPGVGVVSQCENSISNIGADSAEETF